MVERESTAVVYPGDTFHIDGYRNLIIELGEPSYSTGAHEGTNANGGLTS